MGVVFLEACLNATDNLRQIRKMKIHFLPLTILVALLLSSCMQTLYGIRKPVPLSDAEIVAQAQKFRIPCSRLYVLDTLHLLWVHRLQQAGFASTAKQQHQPLQVKYFDDKGRLLSQHVNCYAQSFPNLRWNRQHAFDQFPPPGNCDADSLFTFGVQQRWVRPLACSHAIDSSNPAYYAVVYWNKFMGRQSKRLIRLVQRNAARYGDQKINIIYVNNDNYHSPAGTGFYSKDIIESMDSLIRTTAFLADQSH